MKKRRKSKNRNNPYYPFNGLTFLRVTAGMNKSELADATGLTCNDIVRMEQKKPNVWFGKIRTVAEYFGVTAQSIVYNDLVTLSATTTVEKKRKHDMKDKTRKRNEVCDRIGDDGEAWVEAQEKLKLVGTDYAACVTDNYSDEPDAHFDLLSFDRDTGDPICIEVKTTTGKDDVNFEMTAPEYDFMMRCLHDGTRYELHRVYYIYDEKRRGRSIYTAQEVIDLFDFEAGNYTVRKKVA